MAVNNSLPLAILTHGATAFGGKYDPVKALFGSKKKRNVEYNPYATSGATYAQDTLARLTRSNFQDYRRNIYPLEDAELDYALDGTQPNASAQKAVGFVNDSFAGVDDQIDRRNSRLGLSRTPDQIESETRSLNTQRGLASATAANRAAAQTYDRQSAILGGSLTRVNPAEKSQGGK